MIFFRINIYLSILDFVKSLFYKKVSNHKISSALQNYSTKKYNILTSQCRVSFLIILSYLKEKFPSKNEIIIQSYNLPEMINVAKAIGFKVVFIDIDKETAAMSKSKLNFSINHNTAAILLTNIFNSYEDNVEIKKICEMKNLMLIEDNAIYFDNFYNSKDKKIYSGNIGDVSIASFGMMKNLSCLYGGLISTDLEELNEYAIKYIDKLKKFPTFILYKQIFTYLVLKIFSIKFLYRLIFFNIIKKSYSDNIKLLSIFYPSLKFKIKKKLPDYYYSKISDLSLKILYSQLTNYSRRIDNHSNRKANNEIYYYKLSNLKKIKLIKINNFDYQNFLEFPILIDNKKKLIDFLLSNGIDCRFFYYNDCKSIFSLDKENSINSKYYEDSIICLPNHHKISSNSVNQICKKLIEYDNL